MKPETVLDQAALHCESRGRKLTAKRRQVLAGLVKSQKALGLRPGRLLPRQTGYVAAAYFSLSNIRISRVPGTGSSPKHCKQVRCMRACHL